MILNYCFLIGFYLLYFKKSIVIIFYKQNNNKNYIKPKSYYLMSLFSIIKKIIKAILAV